MEFIASLLGGNGAKVTEKTATQQTKSKQQKSRMAPSKKRKRNKGVGDSSAPSNEAGGHAIDPEDLLGVVPYHFAKSIGEFYIEKKKLGTGQFGAVFLGVDKKTKERVAYKSMKHYRGLASMEKKKIGQIRNEIVAMEISNRLESRNIIHLHAVVETGSEIYMVMEPMEGGELFDRIVKKHHYSEHNAAEILGTLSRALLSLHEAGIVHRDIKPENLLFKSTREDADLKVIDFGLAKIKGRADAFGGRIVGTPGYFAPESFLRKEYSELCDVYSLGVVLYIMLCGFPPFGGEKTTAELCSTMENEEYEMGKWGWENISHSAKDLVSQMLRADPEKRITLEGVIGHRWAHPDVKNSNTHLKGTVTRMVTWNARRKLRSAVRAVIMAHRLEKVMLCSSKDPARKRRGKVRRTGRTGKVH